MRYCTSCGARFTNDDVQFCPNDGSATQELPDPEDGADPLVGRVIDGRYRIEEKLGEGGMGMVYLATHSVLGKRLALKVLHGDMAKDADTVQRFIQEAQAATSIGHENIIDISDFGKLPDGAVYFVMELLEGSALTDLIGRGGSIPVHQALAIIRQMASALGAAHSRGIVHRDLKPDNVFLIPRGDNPHFVKVLDFGIAKVGGAASKLTKTGMVFGTPHYMSPEQAAGQSVDHRTDIYALGVIMYEMFTGKVPFDADTFMGILSKHMFEDPVPPSAAGSEARLGAIEDIILKCLAKKPEDRYQQMNELVADLDTVRAGGSVDIGRRPGIAPPASLADSLEPPSRTEMRLSSSSYQAAPELPKSKTPLIVAAIAGALVVVGGGVAAALFAFGGDGAEEPTPVPPVAVGVQDAGPPQPADAGLTGDRMVEIRSEPSGAQVLVGGAIIGNTPVDIPAPEEGNEREVQVRHRGYESQTVRLTHDSPDGIDVTLEQEEEEEERETRRVRRVARTGRRTPTRTMETEQTTMTTQMRPPAVTQMRSGVTTEVVDPWAD